eukprot:Unigene9501_Nuclearia_a/m.29003 Unigene9501_Nuclearia_a/g.29003  ORF Unigene9501_Nuclearia_a/g.29003 Unigene9501_Nuclearia_a/m.29003 type:complete len:297 (-) Unigene9501_Nuclearia_a:14-904(-)
MANLMKGTRQVHGMDPQFLIEKIVRERVFDSLYWKQECFALTAETVIERGVELKAIGGVSTAFNKPSPFLCLVLKLLQLQPDKEIIIEYIKQEDFKYLRALGAFYLRMIGRGLDIYNYLEPLYNDYRKLRRMTPTGGYDLTHMDEFVDELLHGERVLDVMLPRLVKRKALEETDDLEPRRSALEDDLDELLAAEAAVAAAPAAPAAPAVREPEERPDWDERRDRDRERLREREEQRPRPGDDRGGRDERAERDSRRRDRSRSRSRSRSPPRRRDRSRSRSPPRRRDRSRSRDRRDR